MANGVRIGTGQYPWHDRDRPKGWTELPGAGVGGCQPALWRVGQWRWAQMLGHCHMYWPRGGGLLPDSGPRLDGEVPKDKKGGIFHLGPFMTDLIVFIQGSR